MPKIIRKKMEVNIFGSVGFGMNGRIRICRFIESLRDLLNVLREREKGHYCDSKMYENDHLEKPIKKFEVREYGVAVEYCFEHKGKLFVSNYEYCNQVNYCPFCGYKAINIVELN